MKELFINGNSVTVRATPLALLYYKQEFGTDLLGDLISMQNVAKDPAKFNSIGTLQLVWAMAKAHAYGKPFPSFEAWLHGLGGVDFSDTSFLLAATEEAANGFLGRGRRKG